MGNIEDGEDNPFDCSKSNWRYKMKDMTYDNYCTETDYKALAVYFSRLLRLIKDVTEYRSYLKFYKVLVKRLGLAVNTEDEGFKVPDSLEVPEDYIKAASSVECVNFLKDSLSLSDDEAEILACAYRTMEVPEFFSVTRDLNISVNMIDIIAAELGKNRMKIKKVLGYEGKLISFGFLDADYELTEYATRCIENQNLNVFFEETIKNLDCKDAFEFSSFSVGKEKTDLIKRFLKSRSSANILLYGASGSGKTEYAKALAKASGLVPLIYKNSLEVREGGDGADFALKRMNFFLSLNHKKNVIIVDEAETILKTSDPSSGSGYSLSRKGTVNKMLEDSGNKVIWILNYTSELDDSTLRRFTYSLHFSEIPKTMLALIAENKLGKVKMPEALRRNILKLFEKYRVTGASVDNIVKTVKGMRRTEANQDKVLNDVREVLEANSRLIFGKEKMRREVNPSYDLSVLNTSIPAEEVVEMVQSAREYEEQNRSDQSGIRMLFYGDSGTGKTELARYLAKKLNKKLLIRRASDIMGSFVGDTEKNISCAFEMAEQTDSILLFDEADSFFADRTNAKNSWERTMVNEFLTQMEEFSGILICTTNLRSIMDPAMQRRFHIMTEFKPLKKDGIRKLLQSFFGKYSFTEEDVETLSGYKTVTPGDFGLVSGKIRFVPEMKRSAEYIINCLCGLQEEKQDNTKCIGFAC